MQNQKLVENSEGQGSKKQKEKDTNTAVQSQS